MPKRKDPKLTAAEARKLVSSVKLEVSSIALVNGIPEAITVYSGDQVKVGDYRAFGCTAKGWNRHTLPEGWTDIEVYFTAIDWTTPHERVTALGAPFSGTAIQFGCTGNGAVYATSTDSNSPQRYWGFSGQQFSW